MGLNHSPKIVTNGLVFYADAGNVKSYSGSGTTWSNMSSNNLSGTLTNSPTFTTNYFSFNGTNQWVDFGTPTLGVEAGNKTVCAWINPTALGTYGIVDMDKDNVGGWGMWMNSSGKLWYWPWTNADLIDDGSSSIVAGSWNYVCISYTYSTKTANFYYNGSAGNAKTIGTTAQELAPDGTTKLGIGALRNGAAGLFNGKIASAKIYSRVLTQAEIVNNFNALRGRFGL